MGLARFLQTLEEIWASLEHWVPGNRVGKLSLFFLSYPSYPPHTLTPAYSSYLVPGEHAFMACWSHIHHPHFHRSEEVCSGASRGPPFQQMVVVRVFDFLSTVFMRTQSVFVALSHFLHLA